MADIRVIEDRQALGALVDQQPYQPFLQSWTWGDFQTSISRRIWRLGAYDGHNLVGAALVIEHQLLLGQRYLYCPRGPIANSLDVLLQLYQAIADQGRQRDAMYVKIDPGAYRFHFSADDFPSGWSIGTTLQPAQTMIIDTRQESQSLLGQMHQKTRYNIRLAEKRGVQVRWSSAMNDLEIFLQLMHTTAERQNIRLHSDDYYRRLFASLSEASMAQLCLGEYEGQVIAAHMILWHGKTVTYLHGGSSQEHKDVMAPYLLQWRTIEEAHQRGYEDYDLWGVAPEDAINHRWAGISRFKLGFAGQRLDFPPAANRILNSSWYTAYRLAKRMRGGFEE